MPTSQTTRAEPPSPTSSNTDQLYPISTGKGRSADLPRMSKRLRRVLEEIAETIEVEVESGERGEEGGKALAFSGLQIEYKRRRISWTSPEGSGETRFPKSKMKAVVRSLLSNDAGRVLVGGLKYVSWHLSAEEVAERALENGVIAPVESPSPEGTEYRITQEGIREEWDAAFQLLDDAMEVRICLSEQGRALAAMLQAWKEAKKGGVPIEGALSNENLPGGYLRPSDRRDPGRLRSRGLYAETVGGEEYYGKPDLIVKGSPPELPEKHRSGEGRIRKTLANLEVREEQTGEARPVQYVERQCRSRPEEYIVLENGMRVDVQSALYLRQAFPNGIWTTGHYEAMHSRGFGDEGSEERVESEFVVVVDEDGTILAALPPYKSGQ